MEKQEVVLVVGDVQVPFLSLVLLFLKLAVAAIPAILILHIALKFIAAIR